MKAKEHIFMLPHEEQRNLNTTNKILEYFPRNENPCKQNNYLLIVIWKKNVPASYDNIKKNNLPLGESWHQSRDKQVITLL